MIPNTLLHVEGFFDSATSTVSYLVLDPVNRACALIDSVLDYDPKSGRSNTTCADRLIARVTALDAKVEWILETHVHADHLTAAPYLKDKLGGKVGIGAHISTVQKVFAPLFNTGADMARDGSQFDHLFADNEPFSIGTLQCHALHTPGHTPACMTYVISNDDQRAAFVGDTLFMPDEGTARCDFPGGDAGTLYRSIKKVLSMPPETLLFMCHDYQPGGREVRYVSTVAQECNENIHLHNDMSEAEFVALRNQRDATLDMPTLFLPSVQINMRAGHFPAPENNGMRYLKIPLNADQNPVPADLAEAAHTIVIIGGGAAGIATAASLLTRQPDLDIAIIDPADIHYYQPGWTLVGAGVFTASQTVRTMTSIIPAGARWIRSAVTGFEPERNAIILDDGKVVRYKQLVVCPGLKLDWQAIDGLSETLGKNGVTSNYLAHLAPYTWELVQKLRGGRAIFTQPPMPIKCAGAPQKAMYLSADHWKRSGVLDQVNIEFCNAGGVLFAVSDYVPALMEYIHAYGIALNFGNTLTAVDGPAKKATFSRIGSDGQQEFITRSFDLLHVVPPQVAPDFIRNSPLADAAGWIDVDPATLQHKRWGNIHALGDVANTTNAKTAAAARKQAPVVAHNVLAAMGKVRGTASYDGYGSCPLTVERGKIVLAEFTYGGKVAPTFPAWLIDGTRPSRLAWLLKERFLPPLYWRGMLKGREWLAKPALKV